MALQKYNGPQKQGENTKFLITPNATAVLQRVPVGGVIDLTAGQVTSMSGEHKLVGDAGPATATAFAWTAAGVGA